jgi:cell division protein FtsN
MSNPEFSGPGPKETSLPDWYQLFLEAKERLQTQDSAILGLTQKFEEMETRMRQMQYEAFQNTTTSANATPPLVVQSNYKPAHPTPYNEQVATVDSAGRDSHAAIAYSAPVALLVGCYAVS